MITVHLNERELTQNAKTLRSEGEIPGIISFPHSKSVPVSLKRKEVAEISQARNEVISLAGMKLKSRQAVLVGVQKDVLGKEFIHFSLEALEGGASQNTLTRPVKIAMKGSPEWIKPYHTMQLPLDTLHIEGDLRKIPNIIEIDLSSLKEGETIHGKDIKVPKGTKVIEEDLEKVFVTVTSNNLDLTTDTEQETPTLVTSEEETTEEITKEVSS